MAHGLGIVLFAELGTGVLLVERCVWWWDVGGIVGLVLSVLIVGLEETNSSPILPEDSAAGGFTGWDAGSTKTQVGGQSYGNANSCTHEGADLRVGEVPLLS